MDQNEKIVQITGSGDVVYALSSEGKLFVGTLSDKKGFEWRRLPEMPQRMNTVRAADFLDESSTLPEFAIPEDGIIKTAKLIRDEPPPAPKEEAPKAETPKVDPLAQKK